MHRKSRPKADPDDRQIIPLSIKLSARLEQLILEIGSAGDRGKSYVVRELLRRGLTLYQQDGQIKPTKDEEQMIAVMSKINETASKLKIPREKELYEKMNKD